jgi:hypothetical protein
VDGITAAPLALPVACTFQSHDDIMFDDFMKQQCPLNIPPQWTQQQQQQQHHHHHHCASSLSLWPRVEETESERLTRSEFGADDDLMSTTDMDMHWRQANEGDIEEEEERQEEVAIDDDNDEEEEEDEEEEDELDLNDCDEEKQQAEEDDGVDLNDE